MADYQNIINEISNINHAIGAPELTKPVSTLLDNSDKTVYIAVLGQFKSGKSSLINSIVGESILPVGVVPVTAIVTRLHYSIKPNVIIHFINGNQINTSIDELSSYVTEKCNPENIKGVAQAIVEHPAMKPFKNINFVDTPGLGSFYKHNSETTLEWMPYTGVAIISVSAERPLSEEDINLLKGIAQYCPDIALIITKTDLFGEEELSEIRSYIANSVKKAIGRDVLMFDYSVFKDPVNYRNALIEKLISPLNLNSEIKLKEITRYKTLNAIHQSLIYTDIALQVTKKRDIAKDSINRLLQDIRDNRQYHEREMLFSGTSFKSEVRDKLKKIILPYKPSIIEKITKQFNADYPHWKGSLYKVSREYENWLKEKLENEVIRIDGDTYDQVNQIVSVMVGYYQFTALRFRQLLDEKINHELGVHLPESYWQIDFTGIEKPDISIYNTFDSHIDLLFFFLPMKLFKNIFFGHFNKQILYETDKNLHRYISDVTEKIFRTMDRIYTQALQFISIEIKTVESILQQTDNDYTILQNYLNRLNELKSIDYDK
jgi:GTPase Era involved in 16S rRNA processing